MKIRIISDLHLDVNDRFPLTLPEKDREVFTLLAGDIAGEFVDYADWIKENCPNGAYVAGNHLVYNYYGDTIQGLKNTLKTAFPKDGQMVFLENDCIEIDDVIVVGATLYTNFTLNGMGQMSGMRVAERYLNDFRLGKYDENGSATKLRAEHYLEMFDKSLEYIDKVCSENPDKKIIVLTHHAPSMKSIASSYRTSDANCAYASDLDQFILDRPNIKCWVHGHVHDRFNYMIGGCRVVANPRGYVQHLEDTNWNPSFFIDTDTWETSSDESWFSREMSDTEKEKRKELNDAYELLFRAL